MFTRLIIATGMFYKKNGKTQNESLKKMLFEAKGNSLLLIVCIVKTWWFN